MTVMIKDKKNESLSYVENDNSEFANKFYSIMNKKHLDKFDKKRNTSNQFKFKGDLIFNLKKSKIDLFTKILKTELDDKVVEQISKTILKGSNSAFNYSPMQSIGNMNNFKGSNRVVKRENSKISADPVNNVGSPQDRPDSFIYFLYEYYENDSLNILSRSTIVNINVLDEYLKAVKNLNNYCVEIYNLVIEGDEPYKELIQELIDMGKLPLCNKDNIIKYFNLAIKFWNCRINYYNSLPKNNKEGLPETFSLFNEISV